MLKSNIQNKFSTLLCVLCLFSSPLPLSQLRCLVLSAFLHLSASICFSAVVSSVCLHCLVEWVSHGRPYSSLPTAFHLFIPLCSTFCCIFTPIHASFLQQALHCHLTLSLFPSHSWIGHIQGSNESTQRCLQEARFQRPSWITVTMEISTTMVSQRHTHTDVVLLTDAFILKVFYSTLSTLQFVTTLLYSRFEEWGRNTFQPTCRYDRHQNNKNTSLHKF